MNLSRVLTKPVAALVEYTSDAKDAVVSAVKQERVVIQQHQATRQAERDQKRLLKEAAKEARAEEIAARVKAAEEQRALKLAQQPPL